MRLTLKNKEWACQLTTDMYNKLHDLEDIEEEFGIELIPFLSQLAEAMEQLKKNGLKFKTINFQAKGKKYKLEELE